MTDTETTDLPITEKPAKSAPAKPAASPTVETAAVFEPGATVKHENGEKYIVRYQTPEGVALEGVANLVHPTSLKTI